MGLLYQHQDLVNEAIAFLRQHEPPEGYYFGDSGGKDSTVTRHLLKLSGVKFQGYYSCTGIDPPEVVKFIKQHHSDTIFLYPKMSYWKGILTKFPPTPQARWYCDILKKNPGKNINLMSRVLGIRAEESGKRAKRGKLSKYGKQQIYHPIYYWSEYDIWEHIEVYNLPYCCLYDEGWHRIGCLCCPFASYAEHQRNKLKYPGIYKVFEKVVKQRWEDFKSQGKPMYYATAEKYLEQWYRKKEGFLFKNDKKGLFY